MGRERAGEIEREKERERLREEERENEINNFMGKLSYPTYSLTEI